MIREGAQAPSFELPAVIDGRPGRVALDDFLGETAVILVFYPADFNPSCTDETTDLDEFEVFRMQPDVTVLALSGDSVYSHRAFAEMYDLHIPLLADVHGEAARAYGVTADDDRYTTRRAVVLVDHDGTVVYTWAGDDIEDRPDIEAVQAAFRGIEDADLAAAQYREGCERYDEARDTFVEGMRAYKRREWVLACSEFDAASDELRAATDAFETAARFSEDERMERSFEHGQQVAGELRRALGLMHDSARAYTAGERRRAEELRREGEAVLETLQELGAPPDPDAVPVDVDADQSGPTRDVSLDLEFDPDEGGDTVDQPAVAGDSTPTEDLATPGEHANRATADRAADDGADIGEAELDELTAEIAGQDADEAASTDGAQEPETNRESDDIGDGDT